MRDKSEEELRKRAEELARELRNIHRELDRREIERLTPEQRRNLFKIIRGGVAAFAAGAALLWTKVRETPVQAVAAAGVAATALGVILVLPESEPPEGALPFNQPTWNVTRTPRPTSTPTNPPETLDPPPPTQSSVLARGSSTAESPGSPGTRAPTPGSPPASGSEPPQSEPTDPGDNDPPLPSNPPVDEDGNICLEVVDRPITGGRDEPAEGVVGLCVRDVLGVLD